ncbi:unnamed protein product [Eruca vesicaria subsp. sativa]|uniref:Uncharacterized protein n=1 Tax=Eruca vesicaria subsp. sativa TaxID=29727 RepID=A0ABC8IVL4_ERUVS|nr:unnamed protein product [Eruca vesicaria subsp. sativa]
MQMKKKGKVYPSPPSSSHYLNEDESLSVLRLLPATILVLVSVLSTEDREVLAYLITRGNCGRTSKTAKKNKTSRNHHKPPVFDCECFDCYTNYWFRWDSSPNRELIHQIIEAFENHHTGGENSVSKNKSKRGNKKKEKPGRRVGENDNKPVVEVVSVSESHVSTPDKSPERLNEAEVVKREPRDEVVNEEEESTVENPGVAETGHKGLARKVLPDVLGLLNSSFWRLWNPTA